MSASSAAAPPRLVLGSMTFGDTVGQDLASDLVRRAMDAGVSMIDTANGYAGGATEEMLGRLLPATAPHIAVATKAGMPHPDAGDESPLAPRAVRRSLENSLRRLRRDSVDLFYLHQPDRATPIEETLAAVGELMREGKMARLGVSNFAAWQIAEVNHAAEAVGIARPEVAQQLYNLVARRLETEYLEFARSTGLQTMVYNPLGGGLLSGHHRFSEKPSHGRFGDSRLSAMYTERYWSAELFDAIEQYAAIASQADMSLPELSIRWLVGRPDVSSILLGASRVAHLEANIDAAGRGPLPADVAAACDEVGRCLAGPMPAYNR